MVGVNRILTGVGDLLVAVVRGALAVLSLIASLLGFWVMLMVGFALAAGQLNELSQVYIACAFIPAIADAALTWRRSEGARWRAARTGAQFVLRLAVFLGMLSLLSHDAAVLAFIAGLVLQVNDLFTAHSAQFQDGAL